MDANPIVARETTELQPFYPGDRPSRLSVTTFAGGQTLLTVEAGDLQFTLHLAPADRARLAAMLAEPAAQQEAA